MLPMLPPKVLVSSNLPASASEVAGIIGTYHHHPFLSNQNLAVFTVLHVIHNILRDQQSFLSFATTFKKTAGMFYRNKTEV